TELDEPARTGRRGDRDRRHRGDRRDVSERVELYVRRPGRAVPLDAAAGRRDGRDGRVSAVLNSLRARPGVLALGADAAQAITVRVQMPELWDTLAVRCAPDSSVLALKQ